MAGPLPGFTRRWCSCLFWLAAFVAGAHGTCDPPKPMNNTSNNADPTKDSYEIGSSVTYVCDETKGYVQSPGKPNTITCQEDSLWSEIQEFCERSCKLPPRFLYGELVDTFINRNVFPVGTNVTYKCRPGYAIIRTLPRTITCLDTLEWTEILEFCERKDCGNPGELLNGDVEFQTGDDGMIDTKFGSSVTFVCNPGFRIVGRKTRVCAAQGWTNVVPSCDSVICHKPPDIENGTHTSMGQEEFHYLSGVSYRCKSKEFFLIGEASIYCTEDADWSGPAPKCKEISCKSPHVANANRVTGHGVSHTYKDSIEFVCQDGFVMSGSSRIYCGEDNEWNVPLPVCHPVTCGSPPEITDGRHDGTGPFVYGTSVAYRCNFGSFKLTGEPSIHCTIDGSWSGHPPTCRAVNGSFICDIPSIPHGEVINEHGNKNIIEFRCYTLYVLHGEKSIRCSGENQWDLSFPECHLSQAFVAGIIVLVLVIILVVGACLYWNSKKKQGHYPTNEKGGNKVEAMQLKNSDHAVEA